MYICWSAHTYYARNKEDTTAGLAVAFVVMKQHQTGVTQLPAVDLWHSLGLFVF